MPPLKQRVHDIIFQHDAAAERRFDIAVIVAILLRDRAVTGCR